MTAKRLTGRAGSRSSDRADTPGCSREKRDVRRKMYSHTRRVRGGAVGVAASAGPDFRRRGQDRRAHRHERPGFDADRPGIGDRGANGGRRFRRQGAGQADHRDRRRPSAQAGYRRRHRAALVRHRAGRPDRGRAGVGGRACGAERRQREEAAVHRAFDRHRRFPRQVLLALRHPVGVRYPRARGRHRAGSGQARRRQLVLHHRRLRVRPFAGAGRFRRHRQERRQGGRLGAPAVRARPICRPSSCRRRPRRPRSSASPAVRPTT